MKIVNFDGMRASGKSSQLSFLIKDLSTINLKTKIIHEKNYEPFRSLALTWGKNNKSFSLPDIREIAKARVEVYEHEVFPVIEYRDYLLFDRYFHTSAIYQQGNLSMEEIININLEEGAQNPNTSFIFVCNPILSFKRLRERGNIFESLEEIAKRRELYIELAKQHPELYLIDTTNKTENEVFEEVKLGLKL